MKKILLTLFLLLVTCVPSFSKESVFVPDITTAQAKNAVINYIVNRGWTLKSETEHSIIFYKTRLSHDHQKYQQEELVYKKLKEIKDNEEGRKEYYEKHPALAAFNEVFVDQPRYWNSTDTTNLQIYFLENNGVTIQTDTSSTEIKDMITTLFTGHYSYNIKYSVKKDYVKISDTPQTLYNSQGYYTNKTKLGKNRKIVKINDKNISEYTKASLNNLLNNCTEEQIKLEANDNDGKQVFYINRTYTEPAYKQYL